MVDFCQLDAGSGDLGNSIPYVDWTNNKIYSWFNPISYPPPVGTRLLCNSLTDGSLLNSKDAASCLVVSGNAQVADTSAGIINGFMYAVTGDISTGSFLTPKLSKIDLSTLIETDAMVPVLASNSLFSFSACAAFSVGGVDYFASAISTSANPNFEIVNVTTMTSVGTGHFPHGSTPGPGGNIVMCRGPAGVGTQKLYIMSFEDADTASLIEVTFTAPATIAFATIKTFSPSDFFPDWDELRDLGAISFDTLDNNIIIMWQGRGSGFNSDVFYTITKIDAVTGDTLWIKPTAGAHVNNAYAYCLANHVLDNGTYAYSDELARFYIIDTTDGSTISVYHSHYFATITETDPAVWNATTREWVFLVDGPGSGSGAGWDTPYGLAVWRIDEASPERWKLADSSGFFANQGVAPYRDPADWDFMYQFRTTHDDEGTNTDSGWEIIKRGLKTGATPLRSPVWQFADAGNPFRTVLPGAAATSITNLAGASGGDFLYLILAENAGTTNIAMFRFDKATLNVTAASAPYSLPGTINSYIAFTCVSPDEAYVVSPYFLLSTHVNYAAVWTGDLSSFAFIDLSSIGITSGDQVYQNAIFDTDGFLWLTTKTVTPGTYNPAIAESKLWKLQVSPGPALAVVTSYTIPDNFQSFGDATFASTIFNYNIAYNPLTNKITLLYNYQYPGFGQRRNAILTFDIDAETFSAPLDWGPEDGIVTTTPAWNETDKIATSTGPSDPMLTVVSTIDLSTNPPTKTDKTVIDEWDIPFKFWYTGAPLTGNAIYYSEGSDYFYITGTDLIQYDEVFGFMDAILLPGASPPVDAEVAEAVSAGDTDAASLTAAAAIAESGAAMDALSSLVTNPTAIAESATPTDTTDATKVRTSPLWMSITGGAGRESIFPN